MKRLQVFRILICLMIICMALTACKKNKNKEDGTGDITGVITPVVTPTPSVEDTEDDQTRDDQTIEDTSESEDATNTESEAEYISESEAVKIILNKIGENGYFIELLEEQLTIGEKVYYCYQISDSSAKIEPKVLVDRISGELLCYYEDESTAAFSEFPLYTEPSDGQDGDTVNAFTKEDALAQLSKLSADTLSLPEKLSKYTIIYDEWTTNVKNVECYGIDAYSDVEDKMINMGIFYVAVDGSAMYKFDSLLDDFVEMVIE